MAKDTDRKTPRRWTADDVAFIRDQIEKQGKTQADVAAILKTGQPQISNLCVKHGIGATAEKRAGLATGRPTEAAERRRRAVQEKAEQKIAEEVALQDVETVRRLGFEEGVIEASAIEQARIMRLHRSGATETRETITGMLAELRALGVSRKQLDQLIEMAACWEAQQDPDDDFDAQDKKREAAIKTFSKMLQLDCRADTAKKLVDSMVKIVDLERRVYGIKDDTGETDTVRALKELMSNG